MIVIRKRYLWVLTIGFLLGFGFRAGHYLAQHRIRVGAKHLWINPKAKVNPQKIYHLRLWDYDLPLEQGSYAAFLHEAIRNFEATYPNIRVETTILKINQGPERLAEALRQQTAPDVYCSLYQIPPFDPTSQIPLGPFLTKEEKNEYRPEFLRLCQTDGVVLVLPHWTVPQVWIANRDLVTKAGLNLQKIEENGWSWAEACTAMQKVPKGKYPLVFNLGAAGFFATLNRPYTHLPLSNLKARLELLADLRARGLLPADQGKNMIELFLRGRAMFLAGVRPVIFRFLKEKLAAVKSEWDPVLLPPPTFPGHEGLLTENGVICVYQNRRTGSDDQVAAAVKLAKYISLYPALGPWQAMMLVPASRTACREWENSCGAIASGLNGVMNSLSREKLWNLEIAPEYLTKIYPQLEAFLAGKLSLSTTWAGLGLPETENP